MIRRKNRSTVPHLNVGTFGRTLTAPKIAFLHLAQSTLKTLSDVKNMQQGQKEKSSNKNSPTL